MMEFAVNYLNNGVLEISLYDFVDKDGSLDDNLNEQIHESWLHMHVAKNQGIILWVDCEVTVFTWRSSKYHIAPLLSTTNWTLFSCHYKHNRQIKLSQCTLWSKNQWVICIILFVITSFILNWLYSQSSNFELYNQESTSLLSETSSELSCSNSPRPH